LALKKFEVTTFYSCSAFNTDIRDTRRIGVLFVRSLINDAVDDDDDVTSDAETADYLPHQ